MDLIDKFKQAEFVKIQCDLCFGESIVVDLPTLLRLRRGIRAAAQFVLPSGQSSAAGTNRFAKLLEPTPASDPVARRQHQKIGPAFVLQHNNNSIGSYNRGDILSLETIIWGGDIEIVRDFILVLQALGRVGLRYDAGRFEVVAVRGENSAQQWQQVWTSGDPLETLVVPMRDGAWWLESYAIEREEVCLEFMTPARLIKNGKPLFKASFRQLFPFILRRVTAMLYGHCWVDLPLDAQGLFDTAEQLEEVTNNLRWCDWRELHGIHRQQPLGGVNGNIVVRGNNLSELVPYIYLGSLMNLGKNAAYGAGCYVVRPMPAADIN
ncbi:MAG: CRISPR system precrRNA processing endoribonuclease RAMP protein Cas6 [Desulfuromonas sp.]|nr:CRISPR system precrRNA processing endoribonuclease RAMP protein Cas6 [Desulfuromonas sp.]